MQRTTTKANTGQDRIESIDFLRGLVLILVYQARDWSQYILSARGIASGTLSNFGLRLEAVYVVWLLVILLLCPLCRWYQKYRENNPSKWWLSYL